MSVRTCSNCGFEFLGEYGKSPCFLRLRLSRSVDARALLVGGSFGMVQYDVWKDVNVSSWKL
jgi:hypothetical protein